MEDVLKGLTGKTLTKKKLFDFLADIDFEKLLGGKNNTVPNVTKVIEPEEVKQVEEKKKEVIKCNACLKTFTVQASLRRHHLRSSACVNWNSHADKNNAPTLTKGLHLIINDLLGQAVSENGELKCKWCKTTFTTTGNHHKHFNTANACNNLAFQEFVKIVNNFKA